MYPPWAELRTRALMRWLQTSIAHRVASDKTFDGAAKKEQLAGNPGLARRDTDPMPRGKGSRLRVEHSRQANRCEEKRIRQKGYFDCFKGQMRRVAETRLAIGGTATPGDSRDG